MTEDNKEQLEIGDTVFVKSYQTQTMSGYWHDGYMSGRTGVIVSFRKDYDWRGTPNLAHIRFMEEGGDAAFSGDRPLSELTLVSKGTGRVELGVTHPFSGDELRKQRFAAYVAHAEAADLRHQGFSNPATFIVHFYLDQEPSIHAQLPQLWRQDGTVNPNKLKSLFSQLKLQVDDWAYSCPIETPTEFTHARNPIINKLQVNWDEVAAEFTRSKIQEVIA